MMRVAVVMAAAVVVSVLTTGWAVAQPSVADGVRLRSADELTIVDFVSIVMRSAVPGSRVVAPLHAYESSLACDAAREVALLGHDGSAALVVERDDIAFALYYRTVGQAVRAARGRGWCQDSSESGSEGGGATLPWALNPDSWFFATTLPVSDEEPVRQYLSTDVDRVDASIERGDAEARAYLGDLAENNPES